MHPCLSVGFYVLVQLITFVFVYCLFRKSSFLSKRHGLRRLIFIIFLITNIILSCLPVAGTLLKDSPVKFFCQGAGNIWLGFQIYSYGILFVGSIVVIVFGGIVKLLLHRGKLRDWFLPLMVLSICGSAVLLVYGMQHAQKTIVTEYDVTISKPEAVQRDMKVVLIADLHLSVNSHLPMIRNMVDEINRQNADAVVIAGDIFTSSYEALKNPEQYADVLSQISSRYGTFAVYGNHDVVEDLFGGFPISPISEAFRTTEMEQFFEDCHFKTLYDETVSLADGEVLLTGRVDGEKAGDGTALRKSPAELLADVDIQKPVIVLEHEPVEFAALKESGADLALCGHTHAGQIFPGNLIIPFFNENAYGYKVVSGLQTIVTSGIGYYGPPMRIGTNSEITVVNIHFERG